MHTRNEATQVVNELVAEIGALRKKSRKSPKPVFMSERDLRKNNPSDKAGNLLKQLGIRRKVLRGE